MSEFIEGVVKKIIKNEFIEIELSNVGRNNIFDYLKWEKIRVDSYQPSDISSATSNQTILNLKVTDKIKCYVKSRDLRGNILGKVERVY